MVDEKQADHLEPRSEIDQPADSSPKSSPCSSCAASGSSCCSCAGSGGKGRFFLYIIIVLLGVSLDWGTKNAVFSRLGMPGEYRIEEFPQHNAVHWIIDGVFGFQTSLNTGALFGMGKGMVPVFATCSFIAIAAIVGWLLFFDGLKSRFLTVVLAMISGGILGNLYDRLGLHELKWNYADTTHAVGDPVYAVRDWILVMIGDWPWPNFNIADSLLVCGGILLMLYAVFTKEEPKESKR